MAFKTYPYARNEVPNDDYRRNPNDATKDRVKGILREHGLLSSTAFANLIFDDIKSKGSNFLDVQAIREDGKGRHTSVRRELIVLPQGGVVIDTPGLRGVGLQESGEGLAAAFPDVAALVAQCRFTDCAHATEPGCAVQAALEDGSLPVRRYESWQKLQREAAYMARRTDLRLQRETKKQWLRQTKEHRRDNKPRL